MSSALSFAATVMPHAALSKCLSELAVKDMSLLPKDYQAFIEEEKAKRVRVRTP